ncbi:hypothetical protein EX895_005463 [Sporisorium graminicola]|uniref:Xylanolytic transcriptional activator regulatory domain-containing protein n=1 Tax=Sporisorium graminicola TaxID=280036 RepID=A0A4U7KM30_9BASI|nr:hypothetical protein EX895_005463 [Sporisorium graminicola]TKY85301.1 hypothetical protein EX895_005463 [Sporisorium graminicola]
MDKGDNGFNTFSQSGSSQSSSNNHSDDDQTPPHYHRKSSSYRATGTHNEDTSDLQLGLNGKNGSSVHAVMRPDVLAPPPTSAAISNDPISKGYLSSEAASWLVSWFLQHCHPFLPFLNTEEQKDIAHMQAQQPFLLTTMLAISARFGALSRCPNLPTCIDSQLQERLTQLAETLLGQTLTSSRFNLSDVHAVLFLHAWGLRPLGSGSDSWILSGHAFRLAKRLGIDKTVSSLHENDSQTLAIRRTWLLLCSSDCFPSLGFGRPFSPKENLDLCADIIQRLKHRHLVCGIDIGPDAFVAAQGELAQISRRLLEWVADAASRLRDRNSRVRVAHEQFWTDTESIWHRYRDLNQQLQTCDAQWNEALRSTTERQCAALYRWHVRLCLPSFALRLNDIAAGSLVSDSASTSNDRRSSQSRDAEASRYRSIYQQDILCSSEAIVKLHANDTQSTFAYVPDYLVMALAQACVAHTGLVAANSPQDSALRKQASELVSDTLLSLERLAAQGASLARYLSVKVASIAKKTRLITSTGDGEAQGHGNGGPRSFKRRRARREGSQDGSSQCRTAPSAATLQIGHGATSQPRNEAAHHTSDTQFSPGSSSLQELLDAAWPEAENMDQIAQTWFNVDDPLRLLFGEDIEMLPTHVLGTDSDFATWDT